jgi:hypothetical protein
MEQEFNKGDRVTWKSHGGNADGELLQRINEDTELAGRKVRAKQGRSAVRRAQRQKWRRGSAQTIGAEKEGVTAMAAGAESSVWRGVPLRMGCFVSASDVSDAETQLLMRS